MTSRRSTARGVVSLIAAENDGWGCKPADQLK
jgi:hypothetical protein